MVDEKKHGLFASTIVGVTHEPRDSRNRFSRRAGTQRLLDVPLRGIEPAEPGTGLLSTELFAILAKLAEGAEHSAILDDVPVGCRAIGHKLVNHGL